MPTLLPSSGLRASTSSMYITSNFHTCNIIILFDNFILLVNKRLSHQCGVRGQHSNTQTPPYGQRTRVPKLRYMLVHAPRRWRMAREGSRRSRYCFTVSVDRVESLNERLSHHRVARLATSQHSNTALWAAHARPQAPIYARPRTSSCPLEGLSEEPLYF